jgi:hypothetical protein
MMLVAGRMARQQTISFHNGHMFVGVYKLCAKVLDRLSSSPELCLPEYLAVWDRIKVNSQV